MFFLETDDDLRAFRIRLGERIEEAIKKSNTKQKVADAAGISVEQLNKWAKGTVKVPVEGLKAISTVTNVDFSWLATGSGPAPSDAAKSSAQPSSSQDIVKLDPRLAEAVDDLEKPGMVSIPRYDETRPSAGPGAVAASEVPTTRVAFERHWLVELGVRTDAAVILPAQGDSMEPTIMNGSPMLVDTSKTEIQNGFIYVIAVGNDLLVKRVRRRIDGLVDLISDNRVYEPETLSADALRDVRVVGRVYAAVSRF